MSPKPVFVGLKSWQRKYVNLIGEARDNANGSRRSNHAPGFGSTYVHQQGAAGEYVVSLYTGLPWTNRLVKGSEVGKLNHDVGDDIEVRTRTQDWHDLAMHRNDDRDLRYVLVLSHRQPVYVIAGWLWGREIALPERWHSELPYPAWLAEQGDLRAPQTLLG